MSTRHLGDLMGVDGLESGGHHLIVFATSQSLAWTIAIDRPRRALVYASARRSLVLDLRLARRGSARRPPDPRASSLAVRAARSRLAASHAQSWSRLTRTLALAATPAEIADALLNSVQEVFPDAVVVVAARFRSRAGDRATSQPSRLAADRGRQRVAPLISALTHRGSVTRSLEREPDAASLYLGFGGRLRRSTSYPPESGGTPSAASRCSPSDRSSRRASPSCSSHTREQAAGRSTGPGLRARARARGPAPAEPPSGRPARGAGHRVRRELPRGRRRYRRSEATGTTPCPPDGILQLCVGDVSGRGVGAATVMGRHAEHVPGLRVRPATHPSRSCAG